MICPICGGTCTDTAAFCAHCGNRRAFLIGRPTAAEREEHAEQLRIAQGHWARLQELEALVAADESHADRLRKELDRAHVRIGELEQELDRNREDASALESRIAAMQAEHDAEVDRLQKKIRRMPARQHPPAPSSGKSAASQLRVSFKYQPPSEVVIEFSGFPSESPITVGHFHMQENRWEEQQEVIREFDSWIAIPVVTGDHIQVRCEREVECWLDGQKITDACVQYVEGRLFFAAFEGPGAPPDP